MSTEVYVKKPVYVIKSFFKKVVKNQKRNVHYGDDENYNTKACNLFMNSMLVKLSPN
jgi:hypothetical protein